MKPNNLFLGFVARRQEETCEDLDSQFSRRLSENSVRNEIERKFRRQGGKGKITGGLVNATLRISWPFQRGRRRLQPIAAEGYCRTAS